VIRVIALRELQRLFLAPTGWGLLALVQLLLAWLFAGLLEEYQAVLPRLALLPQAPGVTERVVMPLFASATLLLLALVPLLSMRLVSEERRAQTLVLLTSAPLSSTQIILGKYLGLLGTLGIVLLLLALMPLSLLLGGTLDFGLLISGLLGLALLLAAFGALGLWLSCLTPHPALAAGGGFVLLLLFWIMDQAGGGGVLSYLSLQGHYRHFLEGRPHSSDLVYFALFITTFLLFAVRRLEAERWQP